MSAIAIGLGLGALAGALHLYVTAHRARLVCAGHAGRALLLLPLAFVGPVLAVLLAAALAKPAAWATLPGVFIARSFWLWRRSGADAA